MDPYDVDTISDGLAAAASEPALRARLRKAGPIRAAPFSVTSMAEATVLAYRAALAR